MVIVIVIVTGGRVSSIYLGGVPPSRTLRGSRALGHSELPAGARCTSPEIEEARHETSDLGGSCLAAVAAGVGFELV